MRGSAACSSSPLVSSPIVSSTTTKKKKNPPPRGIVGSLPTTTFLRYSPLKKPRRQLLLLLASTSAAFLLPRTSLSAGEPTSDIFDPVITDSDKAASLAVSRRVDEALRLLDHGRHFQSKGDFAAALDCFTLVVKDYKDLAFTEYARVGRALALYELGDRDEAIAEMEDVSISLKGYPEVHAALAAALYVDKHAPLLAENQFSIATILDPHYTDISYVRDTKHWPPSLVSSLKLFITLS